MDILHLALTIAHVIFLMAVVIFSHHPKFILGLFLFFLGLSHAYENIKIDLYCAKHYWSRSSYQVSWFLVVSSAGGCSQYYQQA